MEETKNQFKTEEDVITLNMDKAGYAPFDIMDWIEAIKCKEPDKKVARNIAISLIAEVLKSKVCALQKWYIHDILAKVSGLAPTYIQRICYASDPAEILKIKGKDGEPHYTIQKFSELIHDSLK